MNVVFSKKVSDCKGLRESYKGEIRRLHEGPRGDKDGSWVVMSIFIKVLTTN